MGLPPTIQVASIGIPDTMLLMLLALVVFGPRRLPEIGRQIGKLMYEFRKVSNDFKFQMEEELRASEEAERQQKLQAQTAQANTQINSQASTTLELNAPAQPTSDSAEISQSYTSPEILSASASEATPATDQAASETSQRPFHEEPHTFPSVMPPSTGEIVEAARPFRGRVPEAVEAPASTVNAEPASGLSAETTAVAATETPAGTEHEANHA
ncbi:twin-arginine translocase TatA/TatE family subunit [Acidicapsa ligni]|uniref:twin-arginine translocase TatA/TatE family subunit n=1 Tax=Acidicapsa ligni TaxID=542300 RepID=UPI0021DF665E|nr:twin-arginine translocase TatA/TatE family subunit [Acidicapsa ligni]